MSQLAKKTSQARPKLIAFVLVTGIIGLLLAGESVRVAWAIRLGKSSRIADIRRAVSLDGANPYLHFRLGMAESFDLNGSVNADGAEQLRLATELSPRETRYWSALASACQFEGDKKCAGRAIASTLALSPMAPRIHWQAANYYLWANRQEQALRQFRRLLELDPNYAGATFRASLGSLGNPELVYRTVLAAAVSPKLKLDYVNFLSSHDNGDFAFQIWKKLVASKAAFDFSDADPYLEYLIHARKYQEALSVWDDLEARGIVRKSGDTNNLIFNGGFEHTPLNSGFDWRYQREPYVSINFEGNQPRDGKHCLRVDFRDVENHPDEPVYQLVPVRVDQTYVLTAQVRSDNIVSDSGPRLRVTDPACRQCLTASSDEVIGTTRWHQITLRFHTGPHTSAVRVSLWRARSMGYPTGILGTLWVDQVSLRSVTTVSAQTSPKKGTS